MYFIAFTVIFFTVLVGYYNYILEDFVRILERICIVLAVVSLAAPVSCLLDGQSPAERTPELQLNSGPVLGKSALYITYMAVGPRCHHHLQLMRAAVKPVVIPEIDQSHKS